MIPTYQTSQAMHHYLSLLARGGQSKPGTLFPDDLHSIFWVYLCCHEERAPHQMDGWKPLKDAVTVEMQQQWE